MAHDLKTYSVLIAWCDGDHEQGEYGWTGRAADPADAQEKARRDMWVQEENDPDDYDAEDPPYGTVLETAEGAIWRAADMEKALRDLVAWESLMGGFEAPAWEAARKIVAELDNLEEAA